MLAKYITHTMYPSMKEKDWNVLWSEIQAGNQDSLSKIFCCTYSQLFNYGYKITLPLVPLFSILSSALDAS